MTATIWNVALVQLTLYCVAAASVALTNTPQTEKRCDMERAYNMIGFYCANRNLREVPQYLKSDVEVCEDVEIFDDTNSNTHFEVRSHSLEACVLACQELYCIYHRSN